MQLGSVLRRHEYSENKATSGLRVPVLILTVFVLMGVAILYVWSHVRMTELEYQVAKELSIKEKLIDEQRKLKVEQATLRSPQRIEAIAKEKLGMSYPESDQVIVLKLQE